MLRLQNFSRFINSTPILQQINLELHPKEVVCLLGPNGAGKSTFLTTICDPFPNYEGEVFYQVKEHNEVWGNLRNAADRKHFLHRCSYLGHEPGLFYDFSVEQNLSFFHRIFSLSSFREYKQQGRRHQDRIDSLLDLAGLSNRRTQMVRLLSRGLKQRLALLRNFLCQPKFLLLDEPLTALDLAGNRIFRMLLLQAIENGCLAVIATHEQGFFEKYNLATRYVFLKQGRLIADISASRYDETAKRKVKQMLYG